MTQPSTTASVCRKPRYHDLATVRISRWPCVVNALTYSSIHPLSTALSSKRRCAEPRSCEPRHFQNHRRAVAKLTSRGEEQVEGACRGREGPPSTAASELSLPTQTQRPSQQSIVRSAWFSRREAKVRQVWWENDTTDFRAILDIDQHSIPATHTQ